MKKKLFLFGLVIILSGINRAIAQQQPENPGFELWEQVGFGPDTLEPVDWNSLKTSDGGDMINEVIPVVWEQSTDAHSGMYSIKLFNEPILTLVAPGTLTNGRVHAVIDPADAYVFTIDSLPEFNTSFTDKPDSLTVWAKFFPFENDIAHVIAILHTDTAKIADPAQTNWIAVANIDLPNPMNDWTRHSAPFQYLSTNTPEYILFAMYAGDAQNSQVGSIMYLDDFELIYNNTSVQTLTESNFNIYWSGKELIIKMNSKHLQDNFNLEILDLTGRVIYTRQIIPEELVRVQLNVPAGIYICKIQNASFTFSKKFIIR
jgi:hypothetical protein